MITIYTSITKLSFKGDIIFRKKPKKEQSTLYQNLFFFLFYYLKTTLYLKMIRLKLVNAPCKNVYVYVYAYAYV